MNLPLSKLALCALLLVSGAHADNPPPEIPALTADGFAVPKPNPSFVFPRDHGSHPEYKIEWWYLTGHLQTRSEASAPLRRYGFQATFFRSAAPLSVARRPAPPAFGHDQIYLAHMALIDIESGRFLHQERLNRAGWDAAAATHKLDVRNGDWNLRMSDTEVLHLSGGIRAEARFNLTLSPVKPLVKFGENGYSRKGSAPTAASYYLTYSRLSVEGDLQVDGRSTPVIGQAWMDHEYSSSQLDENQIGWDWLSAQLDDGREIMFYALRLRDGSFDPASRLTWVDQTGQTHIRDYHWEVLSRWRSPHTGAEYPQRVRLITTDPADNRQRIFQVIPYHADQELTGEIGGVAYWEGACRIEDENDRIVGRAYMELTGYDKPVDVVR